VVGALIAQRQVFAGYEVVRAKSISGFVIISASSVVVKNPASMLTTTWLVCEHAELFIVMTPKASHSAVIAMRLPEMKIDVPFVIERRYELIAVNTGARWKILGACKMQANSLERMGQ
jgi:hypothetical protein